jgi:hypothetical protein
MARRVEEVIWCAVLLGTMIASTFSRAAAKENPSSQAAIPLVTLAAAQFPNLTEAERGLLLFADLKQRARGEFALAGPRADAADASNDPTHADQWNHERDVRADLIRWLSVNPAVSSLVDPRGIRLLAARVTGRLDLSQVHVPFPIVLRNCAIPERLAFAAAKILYLDLGVVISVKFRSKQLPSVPTVILSTCHLGAGTARRCVLVTQDFSQMARRRYQAWGGNCHRSEDPQREHETRAKLPR